MNSIALRHWNFAGKGRDEFLVRETFVQNRNNKFAKTHTDTESCAMMNEFNRMQFKYISQRVYNAPREKIL